MQGIRSDRQSAWRTMDEGLEHLYRRLGSKPSPREKKKSKKAKCLSEEALQIAEKTREKKGKEKRTNKSIWMQSSKEKQGEIRKAS